jgi:hypothetical protein
VALESDIDTMERLSIDLRCRHVREADSPLRPKAARQSEMQATHALPPNPSSKGGK